MEETYYTVDKRKTPCVEPSGYQRYKRQRLQFFCHCSVCGTKQLRYVNENGEVGTGKKTGKGRKTKRKSKN